MTYADLITLLMVFFIVMYATSQSDIARFTALATSLQKAFRVPVLEGQDMTSVDGRDGPPAASPDDAAASTSPAQAALMRSSLYQAIRADVEAYSAAHNFNDQLSVDLRRDGVLVSISGELLFEAARADLQPGARQVLWVVAARLPGLSNEVRVAGHTDDVVLNTPQFPSNWELSTARALTVLRFLRDQMHIEPERLVVMGYGQYRPVASNETRDGRAKNRRVEILVADQGTGLVGTEKS